LVLAVSCVNAQLEIDELQLARDLGKALGA
jgi:hypothetical protein